MLLNNSLGSLQPVRALAERAQGPCRPGRLVQSHLSATTQAGRVWQDGLIQDTTLRDAKRMESSVKHAVKSGREIVLDQPRLQALLPGLAPANGLLCE